ncbi:MAG TPA: iron-containing alcohol dehydrogenase [Solirubrobacterales bacterium]|nr:iron-containing alcohol dehydrogenase [Solirubrobacterales bacterium]
MSGDFVWRDAGRTVLLRRDGVAEAPQLLQGHGFESFELLSTPRALAAAPQLAEAATAVHEIGPGQVPDLAADLLGAAELFSGMRGKALPRSLVAFGGGRTIDVAKAIASVAGAAVAAVPTTMSGAEMTGIHRLPAGYESRGGELVRPSLVIADPVAMTSQEEAALRASSMNAIAHGADSICTPFANPMSELAAVRGVELIATSLDRERERRDPAPLALGSLLCGYAIDSGMFGLHHVVCQTLVRVCGSPHAETNAAILPRSLDLLIARAPDRFADLMSALETDPGDAEARLLELGGEPPGLGAAGADRSRLGEALDAMLQRPELAFTPEPAPTREELAELIERAW